jgi:hypothetical protein
MACGQLAKDIARVSHGYRPEYQVIAHGLARSPNSMTSGDRPDEHSMSTR